MKTFDGREKSLLRAAARDVLPKEIVDRVKSPYPSTQDPNYPLALRAALTELAGDPKAPGQALADPAAVAAALSPERDPQAARPATEVLLTLDGWLRAYPVSLRL